MNIILAGPMGRYPFAGVAWCSLMYLLGLRRLGHQVWYLEDSGECNFDTMRNMVSRDPSYAVEFIRDCLAPYGLGDRWCYVDWLGQYHGHDRAAFRRVCAEADLLLDLSGGCWLWRDEYARIPHAAFIDSDPGFTQLTIAGKEPDSPHTSFFTRFGTLFTYGRNIGTPASPVPTGRLTWEHTWQPVCTDEWRPTGTPPRGAFTTVMSWQIESFQELGGNKDIEMRRLLDLPARAPAPLELALSGPRGEVEVGGRQYGSPAELVQAYGWLYRDAFSVSHNLETYHDYICSSLGEFSVAKHLYVAQNTGWFSDRTACYLAAGRPAVVQDTGFSAHIPADAGLLAFHNIEEALAALENVVGDYERHARIARELALAYFAPEVLLPPLLERATARHVPDDGRRWVVRDWQWVVVGTDQGEMGGG